jgi:hypothetical protein
VQTRLRKRFRIILAQILEKTVSLTYYSTEYIFITNNSDQVLDLSFELIDENLPQQWSATGCTNMICYTNIPDDGSLGILAARARSLSFHQPFCE